jgi:site-specific DNA-methyltransferase (adenine-specific)
MIYMHLRAAYTGPVNTDLGPHEPIPPEAVRYCGETMHLVKRRVVRADSGFRTIAECSKCHRTIETLENPAAKGPVAPDMAVVAAMTPTWVSDCGTVELWLGDCRDVLPTLGPVDAVVTDPPYGIGYSSSWKTSMNGELRTSRSSFGEDTFNDGWIILAFQVASPNACLYCFTRWDVLQRWKESIEGAGWKVKQRLIWNKCHWKMGDLDYYGSQTEDVLFAIKGHPEMQYANRCNLFVSSSAYLPEGQFDHPTQKPEVVLRKFVADSTTVGATVLDPFMGSGTTGVACVQLGRRFVGVEIDEGYFKIAVKRISDALLQIRMPI